MIYLLSQLLSASRGAVSLLDSSTQSAAWRLELGAPVGRVMPGQDNGRKRRRGARIRELGRDRLHVDRLIGAPTRGRERSRARDHCFIVFQPLAVIEGDRAHDAAPLTIRSGEAALLDRALRNDHLVAERLYADALDVDAELA
jgi:hypothetical protein